MSKSSEPDGMSDISGLSYAALGMLRLLGYVWQYSCGAWKALGCLGMLGNVGNSWDGIWDLGNSSKHLGRHSNCWKDLGVPWEGLVMHKKLFEISKMQRKTWYVLEIVEVFWQSFVMYERLVDA